MKLFNKAIDTKLFKQYPLGSDLSKQEVVVKIFNPQGNQSWFILNSDPNDPDYLWAIVDMGYGAEVGSVSRSELETYKGRFGLGFERDLGFDPINAEELLEGLGSGKFYAKGGLITEDKLKEEEWFSPDMKIMYQYRNGRLGITLFYGKDRRYSKKTVINNASELSIKELNSRVKEEVAELKQFAKEMLENNFAKGGLLVSHGLEEGDTVVKTIGSFQKVKTKDGSIVYVDLENGYRDSEPPLPFKKGGEVPSDFYGVKTLGKQVKDDKGLLFWKSDKDHKIRITSANGTMYFLEFGSLKEAEDYVKKINLKTPNFFSSTYAKGGKLDDEEKYEIFKNAVIKYSDTYELGEGYSSRFKGAKNKNGDLATGEYLVDGSQIYWNYEDEKGCIYIDSETPAFYIDLTGTAWHGKEKKYSNKDKKFADGGGVHGVLDSNKNPNQKQDLIRERYELLNDFYNNEDSKVDYSDIAKVGDVLYGDDINGYARIVKEVNDPEKGDYFVLQDRFDNKFAFYVIQIVRDLHSKDLKIQNVDVSEKDFLYSDEVIEIKKSLEFHKGRVSLYKKNPNDASNYHGINYSDYKNSESKIKELEGNLRMYLKHETHSFADGGNIGKNLRIIDGHRYVLDRYKELSRGEFVPANLEQYWDVFLDKIIDNEYVKVSGFYKEKYFTMVVKKSSLLPFSYNKYADGGDIDTFSDNQLMIMNQNAELEHHHEELEDILKEKTPVPAWVVSKMTSSVGDLVDVTHFLDGQKEIMEDQIEEDEEEDEDQEEVKNKEVVEPINVSAGTKKEATEKFTKDALGNLKGFLKGMEGIELRDDYTFDYKDEQFEVEPIIKSDEKGVSNAVFTIFNGDGEEVGEVAYSREGGKQKFTANSDLFSWNNAKFEDGGFMNGFYADGGYFDGTIPKVSTYMSTYAKGGEIATAEILGLKTNIMGTTDIEMKISGMRKPQDFIVYPIGKDDAGNVITIQSDTRIGQINLVKGVGVMSQSHSSGAYFVHLQMDKKTPFTLSEKDLFALRAKIFTTSGENVGKANVLSDNSGASRLFAKGGAVDNLKPAFIISNDYIGNLGLGHYDVQLRDDYVASESFFKYSEAIVALFDFLQTEEGDYICKKDPKSQFEIQKLYFLKSQKDPNDEVTRKVVFKISAKDVVNLKNTYSFELGGFMNNVYEDGGNTDGLNKELEASFIEYKDSEIMYEPHYNKYYANDVEFDSLKEAKDFIDSGKIDVKIRDAYSKGLFAKGGSVKKYIDHDDIKSVTLKLKGKEVTIKGSDVLNGANILEKGGDLSKIANYVKKSDVIEVETNDGEIVKPANGYWVKKGAEPIGAEPTPTASSKEETKFGETYIGKGAYGWKAETYVDGFNGYDWNIVTLKRYSGDLISTAKAGKSTKSKKDNDVEIFTSDWDSPTVFLVTTKPSRLTEKVIKEQHEKALANFKKYMKTGSFKMGGKISNFEKLSQEVAKEYVGDKVKPKYQKEYGKTYDADEAKEVGNKVAGKIKAMQTDKKALGGSTEIKKPNSSSEMMKKANDLAKQIREEGESWNDAKRRAFAQLKK